MIKGSIVKIGISDNKTIVPNIYVFTRTLPVKREIKKLKWIKIKLKR
jgi:hypothetical protein